MKVEKEQVMHVEARTTSVSNIFTLSCYGGKRYKGVGIGHVVDGLPPDNPAFAESLKPFCKMIEKFKEWETGTKIRVTMEVVKPG